MPERVDSDTQWWMTEPPIDEHDVLPEPPEPVMPREYLDGTKYLPLFEDTRITETDSGLSFHERPRIIDTPSHGKWALEIFGSREWLKERDDYGNIRFTESGIALWVPHLFPFEDTREDGLPLIQDRERCEMTVRLQPLSDNKVHSNIKITTSTGQFTANESPESYNPDHTRYFHEFEFIGRALVSELVTYPDTPWLTLSQYLANPSTAETAEDYIDIMLGRKPWPIGYEKSLAPNDWQDRQPSGAQGQAFGTIWVPVDDLRYGIDAAISFPCFGESPDDES